MPAKKHINPFYILLIPVGVVFTVTAAAYVMMAFTVAHAVQGQAGRHAGHQLIQWLRLHGDVALLVELAILAVLTIGAIVADRWWDHAERDREKSDRLADGR